MSTKLSSMELLALSNLMHRPQRFASWSEPLMHLEALGLVVAIEGKEWKLFDITPAGRQALGGGQ
jgi:hypothetical protein